MRCFKPGGFKQVNCHQIHHFCDASTHGYGFESYLRMVDEDNVVHCFFLWEKGKVTPPHSKSITRLKLVAGSEVKAVKVLAVKADHWIRNQVEFPNC